MLLRLNKGADWLIRLSALIGTIGLIVEVCVILADVTGRYFGFPLRGGQDLTQMGMVIIVFGGMALCDKLNGHVNVDLFEARMPRWMIKAGDVATTLIGIAIFAGIAWTTYASIMQMRGFGIILTTNIINLPFDWFKGAIVVLSIITVLGMIMKLIAQLFGPLTQKDSA